MNRNAPAPPPKALKPPKVSTISGSSTNYDSVISEEPSEIAANSVISGQSEMTVDSEYSGRKRFRRMTGFGKTMKRMRSIFRPRLNTYGKETKAAKQS